MHVVDYDEQLASRVAQVMADNPGVTVSEIQCAVDAPVEHVYEVVLWLLGIDAIGLVYQAGSHQ